MKSFPVINGHAPTKFLEFTRQPAVAVYRYHETIEAAISECDCRNFIGELIAELPARSQEPVIHTPLDEGIVSEQLGIFEPTTGLWDGGFTRLDVHGCSHRRGCYKTFQGLHYYRMAHDHALINVVHTGGGPFNRGLSEAVYGAFTESPP